MDFSWKISWHTFFLLSELSPFLELYLFEEVRMTSDACHILWTVHGFEISYMDSSWKISCPVFFFLVWVISLSGVMLLWKKSEWNFVCKISWTVKKKSPYFSGVMALWKFGHFKLVGKISQKLFELGAWIWSADRGWWVDYLIKLKKIELKNLVSWYGIMSRLPV